MSTEMPLETQQRRLGELVYEKLLSQLMNRKILPGSRISVDKLARELDVSKTPIRTALTQLESEGLVISKHNSGFFAAPLPDPDQLVQIYDMRLLLEPFVARKCAEKGSEKALQELEKLAATTMVPFADLDTREVYGRFAMYDAQFHDLIAQQSGNEFAIDALSRITAHIHLFRLRFHPVVVSDAIYEHLDVLNALLVRDPNAAEEAMRRHIAASRSRMAPYFE